jgi:hypothetical protein
MRRKGIAFALVGLLALAVGLIELSGRGTVNPAVPPATAAAEQIAGTTVVVYVSLRTINAALSTAQEIEVGASVGAQASLQPLKVLEPIDDTVERVADVVFAVAAGAALATVGFGPVAAWGLCLLGIGCLARAVADWLPSVGLGSMSAYAIRLGGVLGVILPLGFAVGVSLGERITAAQWESATAELEAITAEARIVIGAEGVGGDAADTPPVDAQEGGLLSRFGASLQSAGEGVGEAVAAVSRYREAAIVLYEEGDRLFSASLTLIGIFALRILVLPALLLWGAVALMRRGAGAV